MVALTVARLGTSIMLIAFYVALIYCLDPSGKSWGADFDPIFKYVPIILSVVALPFFAVANHKKSYRKKIVALLVALLFLLVVSGAIYRVSVIGRPAMDSFMGRALNMLPFFSAFFMFQFPDQKFRFVRLATPGILGSAFLIFCMLLAWSLNGPFNDQPHIFREEIFLATCASFLFLKYWPHTIWTNPFVGAMLLAGMLTEKYTGYLASLITICMLMYVSYQNRSLSNKYFRVAQILAKSGFAISMILIVATILISWRNFLPSGTPEVRLVTYSSRIELFFESPIVGNMFTGSPFLDHSFLTIPSHSDLLDILAFGGVLGLVLFIGICWMGSSQFLKNIKETVRRREFEGIFFLAVSAIFLMEMAVNPVWDQPKLAFFFWFSLGYLVSAQKNNKGMMLNQQSCGLSTE